MTLMMRVGERLTGIINVRKSNGKPSPKRPTGIPKWIVPTPGIVQVTPSPDGMTATIVALQTGEVNLQTITSIDGEDITDNIIIIVIRPVDDEVNVEVEFHG